MKKKLPSIYHDKTNVKRANNRNVFYSGDFSRSSDDIVMKKESSSNKENDYSHIINTLNSLFTSSHHVFMIPVEVITNSKKYDTKIIYRDKSKISTIDGDTIYLKDIVDIKIKKSL